MNSTLLINLWFNLLSQASNTFRPNISKFECLLSLSLKELLGSTCSSTFQWVIINTRANPYLWVWLSKRVLSPFRLKAAMLNIVTNIFSHVHSTDMDENKGKLKTNITCNSAKLAKSNFICDYIKWTSMWLRMHTFYAGTYNSNPPNGLGLSWVIL